MTCPECGVLYDTAVAKACPLCAIFKVVETNTKSIGTNARLAGKQAEVTARLTVLIEKGR